VLQSPYTWDWSSGAVTQNIILTQPPEYLPMRDFDPNPTVTVQYTRNGDLKMRVPCPFCCKRHLHGPGANKLGPDFGHRLAHCAQSDLPPALQGLTLGYHLELVWEQVAEIGVTGKPRAVRAEIFSQL